MQAQQRFAALFSAGQHQQAVEYAREQQRLSPLDPAWLNAVALALHAAGESNEALLWMGRALALAPARGDFHNNYGVMLRRAGWNVEAIAAYRRALNLVPGDLEALRNLTRALTQDGQPEEAATACRDFCHLNRNHVAGWILCGHAEMALSEWNAASECFRQACALDANNIEAWRGLAQAMNSADRLAEGEEALRRALALTPDDVELMNDLGACLAAAGRHDEALAMYDACLARDPEHGKARYNRGTLRLRHGDWPAGWHDYEARLALPEARADLPDPIWDGRPLEGDLLVHAEQGLGDTLQFMRFLPWARQRCRRLVFEVQPALLPFLASCAGADQVIARGHALPPCTARLPLLSLPDRMNLQLGDLPWAQDYLPTFAEADDPELFLPELLKIGLVWAGNPKHADDRHRSLPTTALEPLLDVPGCRFYSLQFGLADCPLPSVVNLAPAIGGWQDTARFLSALDLLIGVDTSVAHLAAALDKPVWMLIAARSDWRWLEKREDSPWYPRLRLFRQQRDESKLECVKRVAQALREFRH